ncbi:MAG: J domain-containing protein [Acidobacteria bacterium]|nr:J domain-containing protein [Acidobacteriota bacterium]
MSSPDLYAVLEVDSSASADDLKKSYRRLARQYHPDTNPGDAEAEARFKEISQAYEILSDPDRRAHYDRFGSDVNGSGDFSSVQDLFDMFFQGFGGFGGGGHRPGPQPGPDAQVSLRISLHDAAVGARHEVTVTLPVACVDCHGSGAADGTSPIPCLECGGAGQVRAVRNSVFGQMVTSAPCRRCGGFGSVIQTPCAHCRGEGRRSEPKSLTIEIPPGVENGSTMRLVDRGPAGLRGGPNGTLFVELAVEDDPRFTRHGDDLHHEASISFAQAVFGCDVTVPTLEDETVVVVPAGSTHGTVLRVRDQGIPHLRGRGRGDLYIHLAIEVPTDLSPESEQMLRDFALSRGEDVAEANHGLFGRRKAGRK